MIQIKMGQGCVVVSISPNLPPVIPAADLRDYICKVLEQSEATHLSVKDIWRASQMDVVEVHLQGVSSSVKCGGRLFSLPNRWVVEDSPDNNAVIVIIEEHLLIITSPDREEQWKNSTGGSLCYSEGRCRVYQKQL